MKKSLWLTLAVAAVAALFVVAGCAPSPPPDPTPTPDVTPTPPVMDECPSLPPTVDYQLINMSTDPPNNDDYDANVRIIIRFDKEIFPTNLAGLENTNNWSAAVERWLSFRAFNEDTMTWEEISWNDDSDDNPLFDVSVANVALQANNKTIYVDLWVLQSAELVQLAIWDLNDDYATELWKGEYDYGAYKGLVCSETQYEDWVEAMNYDGDITGTKAIRKTVALDIFADEVRWAFTGNVAIYDVLGNPCFDLCDFSGEFCCIIEECPPDIIIEPCPII